MGSLVAALGGTALAFGWRYPDGHYRLDQWHALLLASLWVWWCAAGAQRAWRWRLLIVWAVVTGLVWRDPYGVSWVWLATAVLVGLAGEALEGDAPSVRQALWVIGGCQLAAMGWQVIRPLPLYEVIGDGLAGTLARRGALSAFFGLCAVRASGWWTGAWMLAAASTGSLTGLVAPLLRGVWRVPTRWVRIAGVCGMAGAAWLWGAERLSSRWEVWRQGMPDALAGFGKLPSGFLGDGMIDKLLNQPDYHNTLLELWARFGWWGLAFISGVAAWLISRRDWWGLAWAASVFALQSVADMPVLAWMFVLLVASRANAEVPTGLDSIPQARLAS